MKVTVLIPCLGCIDDPSREPIILAGELTKGQIVDACLARAEIVLGAKHNVVKVEVHGIWVFFKDEDGDYVTTNAYRVSHGEIHESPAPTE